MQRDSSCFTEEENVSPVISKYERRPQTAGQMITELQRKG